MKDYMYIIRGGDDLSVLSPQQMEDHMQDWQKWMGTRAEAGKFVAGDPLGVEGKSLTEGGTKIIDHPLAEAKELVGGYLIMKADNLDDAVELAKGCPGFEHNCSIEVREITPVPA